MWAADDSVNSNDALHRLVLQESSDTFESRFIIPNISGFREPLLHRLWVSPFGLNHRHNDFVRASVVWPVIRDGRNGVAPEAFLGFLPELVALPLSLEGHDQSFPAQLNGPPKCGCCPPQALVEFPDLILSFRSSRLVFQRARPGNRPRSFWVGPKIVPPPRERQRRYCSAVSVPGQCRVHTQQNHPARSQQQRHRLQPERLCADAA